MGQGALSKPVVQWWLSLNSSTTSPSLPPTDSPSSRARLPPFPFRSSPPTSTIRQLSALWNLTKPIQSSFTLPIMLPSLASAFSLRQHSPSSRMPWPPPSPPSVRLCLPIPSSRLCLTSTTSYDFSPSPPSYAPTSPSLPPTDSPSSRARLLPFPFRSSPPTPTIRQLSAL